MWMRIIEVDDIKKPWQKILSSRYIVLDTCMITQSCMMMMSSYLYVDRLILTYVDWCKYSQLMIHGWSCWLDGYGVYPYDIMKMILWWWVDIYMQTYFVIRHLQVVDLEMVVRGFHKEYPHIYACLCWYSCVYVNMEEISGLDLGWEESDMGLIETIWHSFKWSRLTSNNTLVALP